MDWTQSGPLILDDKVDWLQDLLKTEMDQRDLRLQQPVIKQDVMPNAVEEVKDGRDHFLDWVEKTREKLWYFQHDWQERVLKIGLKKVQTWGCDEKSDSMETTTKKFEDVKEKLEKACCSSESSEVRDQDDGEDDEMHWSLWKKRLENHDEQEVVSEEAMETIESNRQTSFSWLQNSCCCQVCCLRSFDLLGLGWDNGSWTSLIFFHILTQTWTCRPSSISWDDNSCMMSDSSCWWHTGHCFCSLPEPRGYCMFDQRKTCNLHTWRLRNDIRLQVHHTLCITDSFSPVVLQASRIIVRDVVGQFETKNWSRKGDSFLKSQSDVDKKSSWRTLVINLELSEKDTSSLNNADFLSIWLTLT